MVQREGLRSGCIPVQPVTGDDHHASAATLRRDPDEQAKHRKGATGELRHDAAATPAGYSGPLAGGFGVQSAPTSTPSDAGLGR